MNTILISPLDEIKKLYEERGRSLYEIGGGVDGVTQYDHALQTATLAAHAEASDSLIVACLLHDIGHLIKNETPGELNSHHDDVHQYMALPFLRLYFDPPVLEPIKLHVEAKRYLCAVEIDYFHSLSDGSKRSLKLQGGPLSNDEADLFLRNPYATAALNLRRWDDLAKDTQATPYQWDFFTPIMERCLRKIT